MKVRIAGIVPNSIVDGEGVRLTVFFQGCPHKCVGCHNPQTHDFNGGILVDTDEIVNMLKGSSLMCGITLSGGEPFCQPEAFEELAKATRAMEKNVWAYTGFTYEQLTNWKHKHLVELCDVLVDGKFVLEERSLSLRFCGSRNQRVIDVPTSLKTGKVSLWRQ